MNVSAPGAMHNQTSSQHINGAAKTSSSSPSFLDELREMGEEVEALLSARFARMQSSLWLALLSLIAAMTLFIIGLILLFGSLIGAVLLWVGAIAGSAWSSGFIVTGSFGVVLFAVGALVLSGGKLEGPGPFSKLAGARSRERIARSRIQRQLEKISRHLKLLFRPSYWFSRPRILELGMIGLLGLAPFLFRSRGKTKRVNPGATAKNLSQSYAQRILSEVITSVLVPLAFSMVVAKKKEESEATTQKATNGTSS